jgi:hypothetical protein
MQNNITKMVLVLGLLISSPACLGANGSQLIQLDQDRNDLLKQITNELSYGHMTLEDAEKTKGELDKIVSLETAYKEGKQVKLKTISLALQKVHGDVKAAIHPNKVWMGIDSHNRALKEKIDAAFDAKKLNRDEADNLGQQEQVLRDRETVNDSSNGLEYDDAVSIAKAIQDLDKKIDALSND